MLMMWVGELRLSDRFKVGAFGLIPWEAFLLIMDFCYTPCWIHVGPAMWYEEVHDWMYKYPAYFPHETQSRSFVLFCFTNANSGIGKLIRAMNRFIKERELFVNKYYDSWVQDLEGVMKAMNERAEKLGKDGKWSIGHGTYIDRAWEKTKISERRLTLGLNEMDKRAHKIDRWNQLDWF